MPVVAHTALPTFAALRDEGFEVLTREEAEHQDIRELHVGLLNLMPDAALEVTERQFVRLLGQANRIVQVFVHPFSVDGLARGPAAAAHVGEHYESFDDLRRDGLDGLVVSGANVVGPHLADQPFYEPLREVMTWAAEHVTSTLCSCLASHALLEQRHGLVRRPLQAKRWGVLTHRVVDAAPPARRRDQHALRGAALAVERRVRRAGARRGAARRRRDRRRRPAPRDVGRRLPHGLPPGSPRVRRGVAAQGAQARAGAVLGRADRRAAAGARGLPGADGGPRRDRARRGAGDRPRGGPAAARLPRGPAAPRCSRTPGPTPRRPSSTTGWAWSTGPRPSTGDVRSWTASTPATRSGCWPGQPET